MEKIKITSKLQRNRSMDVKIYLVLLPVKPCNVISNGTLSYFCINVTG